MNVTLAPVEAPLATMNRPSWMKVSDLMIEGVGRTWTALYSDWIWRLKTRAPTASSDVRKGILSMTIALLVFACAAPILVILFMLKKKEDRATQFVTYVITVCATFAGVWLGLFQADVEKNKDEVQQVSSMTGAAMSALGAR